MRHSAVPRLLVHASPSRSQVRKLMKGMREVSADEDDEDDKSSKKAAGAAQH